ncbi:MAG: diphthamide biosynthesis enzyme Dph2 [Thermoplasmata archaeon]|nr:diphthamide biosynthesis enzyme Dph2 [Thermoplasmata archaeon]
MMEDYFEIDWNNILNELNKRNIKSILIELPEGLKQFIPEIDAKLSRYRTYYSGENIYGSCDTNYSISVDGVLHFGHAPMRNLQYFKNTIFVELKRKININKKLVENILSLNCKRIGILATVQYISMIENLSKELKKFGIETITSEGDDRLYYPSQVLGCDFSAAEKIKEDVDCFIVLADGTFHASGIFMATDKPTYSAEPVSGKIIRIENDQFLRSRYLAMEKAREAKNIGILVSTKLGQYRIAIANMLKNKIIESGRKAFIIVLNEISPQKLINLNMDAYVNTACPRIALDDTSLYEKPILTPTEMEMVLGIIPYDNYVLDRINFVNDIRKDL